MPGFSFASFSIEVSARMLSSWVRSMSGMRHHFLQRVLGVGPGRELVAPQRKLVLLLARDAMHGTSFSVLSPREIVQARHLRVDHAPTERRGVSVSLAAGNAREGFCRIQGERLIASPPPATTIVASPDSIARLPWIAASRLEPQRRLTVAPGT